MWRLIVAISLFLAPGSLQFVLEGSDTSYARFSRWNVNSTVSFEFTTNQPDGLIFYSDDAGKTDFFELKLVEGILRLRFNIANQGTQLVNIGHHLNDGLWHRVEIAVAPRSVVLTVDGFVSERRNVGVAGAASVLNSGVFIGGLPAHFNSRLNELTLASVVFEPRFRGAVRNLVYGALVPGSSAVVKPQDIVESKGLISGSTNTEACERHDPCLHGGFCISTDSGPVCDCKHIDFEGINCEVEKSPTSATFHGTEYIGYDFRESGGHQPIISQLDEISLYFRTSKDYRGLHTLLFYSGDGVDYIALTLRNGQLMLSINLGSGPLDTKLHPDHLRFDDSEWHGVRVHRKIQEITASVDGVHFDRWTLAGSFTLLSSNRVTVAGYDTLRPLNGIRGVTNYVGCLKKVEYRADTLRLNILELARSGNRLITISGGRIVFACQTNIDAFENTASGASIGNFIVDKSDRPVIPDPFTPDLQSDAPITFTQPSGSYLTIPPYNNASFHSTQLSLKLRTTEPSGLILYSSYTPSNILALELLEGHVILILQASSSSPTRITATSTRIHDGEWHSIKLIRSGRTGTITVDDVSTDFSLKGEGRNLYIGTVYLGNVPSYISDHRVWNIPLGNGFVGCLKNVYIEHTLVDLVRLANSQDTGGIRPYCQVGSAGECVSNPCVNNGKCTDGWGRFICECGVVGFEGGVCQVDAPYLEMTESSVFEFTNRSVADGSPIGNRLFAPAQASDIKFRFKTLSQNAVLLSISGDHSDFVEIKLSGGGGRLRVRVRVNDAEKSLTLGHSPLTDNNWHVFEFTRRGTHVTALIDDLPPVSGNLQTRGDAIFRAQKYSISSVTSPFSGLIQSLYINNVELLSNVKLKKLKSNVQVRTFKSLNNPIQFLPRNSQQTYITVPQLKAYSNARLRFKFKTQSNNGVLFYNGAGNSNDYVSVIIQEFKLVVSIGFGDNRAVEISSQRIKPNVWTDVDIFWDGTNVVTLSVDNHVFEATLPGDSELLLHLNGVLYVGGGVSTTNPPFVGCLANVDLGGEGLSFENPTHTIFTACGEGALEPYNPGSRCSERVCEHRGVCVEDDVVSCNCEMTSYAGPTCSLEATSYEFSSPRSTSRSSRPGAMTYTYQPNREPTTLNDNIAFGILTSVFDAVLLRIESTKTTDYLEIELLSGKLRVTYNMYLNKDHSLTDNTVINDNAYHVVRFVRTGANASLQVDDGIINTNYPANIKEYVFNSIEKISIGGRVKEHKRDVTIVRGMRGIISGLVINGMSVLDLSVNGDPRVRIYGDVRVTRGITSIDRSNRHRGPGDYSTGGDFQKAQPASSSSTTSDELVNSGDGHSRCLVTDDEDNEDCGGLPSGFTDDIITPVYIPTTRVTTTITSTRSNNEWTFPCADDDEDCPENGSGATHENGVVHQRRPTTTVTDGRTSTGTSTTTDGGSSTSTSTFSSSSSGSSTSSTSTSSSHYIPSSTDRDSDTFVHEILTTTPPPTPRIVTTRFTPPEPPSPPSYVNRGGNLFDFDHNSGTRPSVVLTTSSTVDKTQRLNNSTIYIADSGDSTLIIIIIIAVLMIIIVSILIIFFMCKRRDDPIYKIEQQVPPPLVPGTGSVQQVAGYGGGGVVGAGMMGSGNGGGQRPPPGVQNPGPRKTGVKEWYV